VIRRCHVRGRVFDLASAHVGIPKSLGNIGEVPRIRRFSFHKHAFHMLEHFTRAETQLVEGGLYGAMDHGRRTNRSRRTGNEPFQFRGKFAMSVAPGGLNPVSRITAVVLPVTLRGGGGAHSFADKQPALTRSGAMVPSPNTLGRQGNRPIAAEAPTHGGIIN
jgi:hypothetical protein